MLFCLLRLCIPHTRLLQSIRPLPPAMRQALRAETGSKDDLHFRLHASGPAVLWGPCSSLLLHADFFERFDPVSRQLVLRQELAHLSRGDTCWNLLAELAAAALWFHPLAWLAMPRFRLDQELACDEHVLRQSPQDRLTYANTLLQSVGIGMNAAPMLIPWLAEPQLKERLTMIKQFRPGALRRRIGFVGVATLLFGIAVMSQAAVSTRGNQDAAPDVAYNETIEAQPIDAGPISDASPGLGTATSGAVNQWHVTAKLPDGKPVAAYPGFPVKFARSVEP